MTTMLLTTLGAVLCFVVSNAEVTPQMDFDLQEISGKWYAAGFATNSKWFTSKKGHMKMGTVTMTPTAEGDLEFSIANLKSDGSCWRMTSVAKKTNTPGRFTFHSQRWGTDNDLRVVDVKPSQYAITHTIQMKAGTSEVINKLYVRSPDVSTELVQKFQNFSEETGVLPANIAILPKNDECPPV